MQSPIKLVSDKALPLAQPADLLSINYPPNKNYKGSFIGDCPAHGNFELAGPFPSVQFRGRKFNLAFVHIHLKSEHLIDGNEAAPFEMHLVHIPDKGTMNDPKVVIGILYDVLPNSLSRSAQRKNPAKPKSSQPTINPSKFFPLLSDGSTPDLKNWFHYEGSLTSYPYSEDVSWFVMKSEAALDPTLVEAFETCAQQEPRPLQPLHRRLVVRSFD